MSEKENNVRAGLSRVSLKRKMELHDWSSITSDCFRSDAKKEHTVETWCIDYFLSTTQGSSGFSFKAGGGWNAPESEHERSLFLSGSHTAQHLCEWWWGVGKRWHAAYQCSCGVPGQGRRETDERIKQGQEFELQTVIHYKFPITCLQGDVSRSH